MLSKIKVSASFGVLVLMLMMYGVKDANAGSKLPDPIKAGVAGKAL